MFTRLLERLGRDRRLDWSLRGRNYRENGRGVPTNNVQRSLGYILPELSVEDVIGERSEVTSDFLTVE